MRARLLALFLTAASGLVAANPADAIICYVVYNKSESVIYQDTYPPVDMSRAGAPAREAMERRGEHLTFGDIPQCPQLVFLTDATGTSALRLDAVLADMPGTGLSGNGMPRSTTRAPSTAAPAAAPSTPAAASAAPKPMKGAY
jgi:hypothetical protein